MKIGILGATGAVGREMIRVLEERSAKIEELRLFASERSIGKKIPFRSGEITVESADGDAFSGLDIVYGATDATTAKTFAPRIVSSGAVFIDNSSAFRLDRDVPLVIPEINGDDVYGHHGVIANPNCCTAIVLTALSGIHRLSPIRSLTVSTYQAVSGAGEGGITELREEIAAEAAGTVYRPRVFPYPILCNLIPAIGETDENGVTAEERKMEAEGRKILHLPSLRVLCTCVRVPVYRSHGMAVSVTTRDGITVDAARRAIASAPGCVLADDVGNGEYPMPITASEKDDVLIGRIRRDPTRENALAFFCVGDQLRRGAALNAVLIGERLTL